MRGTTIVRVSAFWFGYLGCGMEWLRFSRVSGSLRLQLLYGFFSVSM